MTLSQERPSDELTGRFCFEQMSKQMDLLTAKAREKVTLRSIAAQKVGRFVCIRVRYGSELEQEIVIRMSMHWAAILHRELSKVVA